MDAVVLGLPGELPIGPTRFVSHSPQVLDPISSIPVTSSLGLPDSSTMNFNVVGPSGGNLVPKQREKPSRRARGGIQKKGRSKAGHVSPLADLSIKDLETMHEVYIYKTSSRATWQRMSCLTISPLVLEPLLGFKRESLTEYGDNSEAAIAGKRSKVGVVGSIHDNDFLASVEAGTQPRRDQ